MQKPQSHSTSRREFLRASARYGWLVALGGGLAWLSSRPRSPQACLADNLCAGCPAFSDCTLPSKVQTNAAAEPEPSTSNTENRSDAVPEAGAPMNSGSRDNLSP